VQLSSDNRLENLELQVDVDRRALFNDTNVERLSRLVRRNLRTIGVIQLLARDKVRSGHVETWSAFATKDPLPSPARAR